MNELIKELAKQAYEEVIKNTPSFLVTNEMWQKKFAELIVKECALHLHKRGVEGFGMLEERNLKEHFGVENA